MSKPSVLKDRQSTLGLVMSGGGARGAYQAGALKALYEIAAARNLRQPFPIITGVSAGAINAGYLASALDDPLKATYKLAEMWSNIRSEEVFRTDLASLSFIAWEWARDIATGRSTHNSLRPRALLNTAPLWKLLSDHIDFSRIAEHLNKGIVDAVAVSAVNYASAEAIVFYQSRGDVTPWQRSRRTSHPVDIKVEHVMASSAIPLFFPAIPLEGSYFGDGSLRNMAPLSPALHLGADRLIVIGVRKELPTVANQAQLWKDRGSLKATPSIARILSVVLNAVMMDAVDIDLERLNRINRTIALLESEKRQNSQLRIVPHLYLHPSEDIGKIAEEEERSLPKSIRFLLRGLGPVEEGADLISYLMFEPAYCSRLVELGYEDCMVRRTEIESFFDDENVLDPLQSLAHKDRDTARAELLAQPAQQ